MMLQTDIFFNFIEAHYDIFKSEDSVSLRRAYSLYKEFCADTGIERQLPQYKVREELRNYFDTFKDRATLSRRDERAKYYSGFNASKFKTQSKKDDQAFTLVLDETISLLDDYFADQPAQGYRGEDEYGDLVPEYKWKNVRTTLKDVNTHDLHFVKISEQHIVIDFDIKDERGAKSLERNLEAASVWPATYAELSKGGGGVHLHYIYDGDVTELSPIYSEGIEVKTLLGDASLRRRLTRCNNIPVATFIGKLPTKEKKSMHSGATIQSEKSLRDMIGRNLQKMYHPDTASSVSFIKKILDEAYDSGMTYDVSDMRGRITVFANNSTNQSLKSLGLVMNMKFKGKNTDAFGDAEFPADAHKGDSFFKKALLVRVVWLSSMSRYILISLLCVGLMRMTIMSFEWSILRQQRWRNYSSSSLLASTTVDTTTIFVMLATSGTTISSCMNSRRSLLRGLPVRCSVRRTTSPTRIFTTTVRRSRA